MDGGEQRRPADRSWRGEPGVAQEAPPIGLAYSSPDDRLESGTPGSEGASLADIHEPQKSPPPLPRRRDGVKRGAREVVETILLAAVIFVGVRLLVLNFRVDGRSMTPNLHDQELLLVNRNAYRHFDANAAVDWLPGIEHDDEWTFYPFSPPERGDIVVFEPPVSDDSDKPYIKRVIGLPGETVEIRDGGVFVDDRRLDEPYLAGTATTCPRRACDAVEVPEGAVYVLGDNRANSSDSRTFGIVSVDAIVGKALLTYWPLDDFGLVPHEDYPGIPG